MKKIAAGKFKATCLQVMDEVRETREPYVITKRGVPVAKIVPIEKPKRKSIFGCMKGKMEIVGDIEVSPWFEEGGGRDFTLEEWDELEK